VLDKTSNYAEIGGMDSGIKYQQGKHYFSAAFGYVRSVEGDDPGLPQETDIQKRNRRIQDTKNKKFFGKRPQTFGHIPQKVIDAERENARAAAVEVHAA